MRFRASKLLEKLIFIRGRGASRRAADVSRDVSRVAGRLYALQRVPAESRASSPSERPAGVPGWSRAAWTAPGPRLDRPAALSSRRLSRQTSPAAATARRSAAQHQSSSLRNHCPPFFFEQKFSDIVAGLSFPALGLVSSRCKSAG